MNFLLLILIGVFSAGCCDNYVESIEKESGRISDFRDGLLGRWVDDYGTVFDYKHDVVTVTFGGKVLEDQSGSYEINEAGLGILLDHNRKFAFEFENQEGTEVFLAVEGVGGLVLRRIK